MDYEAIEKHWSNIVEMNDLEEKWRYVDSLPKAERKEIIMRMKVDERRKSYLEPYGMADKQEFYGADTDKKLEMLHDALVAVIMDIAALNAKDGAVSEMLKHFVK